MLYMSGNKHHNLYESKLIYRRHQEPNKLEKNRKQCSIQSTGYAVEGLWRSKVIDCSEFEAKSRKYRGVFKAKSRENSRQVRENYSQQLEHKHVQKRATEPSVRVSVPCWHATPIANAQWKLLVIRWRSISLTRSSNWWKIWSVVESL